jgi:predicted  nucleic acid-binding Zn-ribbon protein
MPPELTLLIRLQAIDDRVGELTREIAALPKHIGLIERKLETHERRLEADRAALSANQKDRKRLEGDIQVQEQKISKLKAQMMDAKTNEQYHAFQHEIQFCENEIRKCEDRILDLMGESEPLEKNVKAAEAGLKKERAQVDSEKREARERTAADERALAELQGERSELVAQLPPSLYSQYERLRKARGGVALSEALEGRCSACHMALRLQFWQDLKKTDKVMSCESCGRMLYYIPPAAVEDLGGEEATVTQGPAGRPSEN